MKAAPAAVTPARKAPAKAVAKATAPPAAPAAPPAPAPATPAPITAPTTKAAPGKAPARAGAAKPKPAAVPPADWTPAEIEAIRAELLAEAATFQGEIDDAAEALDSVRRDGADGTGDDQADAGTATFEREHEMSIANNHRDLLVQTQRALQRLEGGTYGVCEVCGDRIAKARLQAFPRATLDVKCKQREERR